MQVHVSFFGRSIAQSHVTSLFLIAIPFHKLTSLTHSFLKFGLAAFLLLYSSSIFHFIFLFFILFICKDLVKKVDNTPGWPYQVFYIISCIIANIYL